MAGGGACSEASPDTTGRGDSAWDPAGSSSNRYSVDSVSNRDTGQVDEPAERQDDAGSERLPQT